MSWEGRIGLLLGAIAVCNAVIAFVLSWRTLRDQTWAREEAERERSRVERERERAERERRAADDLDALAIYTDLTSPTVVELIERQGGNPGDARTLASVRDRNRLRLNSLSRHFKPEQEIVDAIQDAIAEVKRYATPEDMVSEALGEAAIEKLTGKSDTTKYTWESGPPLPKWAMINKIAHKFVQDHAISSVKAFEASFGPEVGTAVGPELSQRLDVTKLLIAADVLPARAVRQTENFDRLTLDGTIYLVAWEMGLPNRAVGVQIHKPVINHFASEHKYPIAEA